MKLRPHDIVSHSSAPHWGSGKVLEVAPDKVTIIFSDGETRKIKDSHLDALQPADPDSYQEPVKKAPPVRSRKTDAAPVKKRAAAPAIPKLVFEEFNFSYPKHLRKQFVHDTRGQIEAWQRAYPFLFDVRDASLANDYQGRALNPHFLGWYAAIQLFETEGYYSLNQNYASAGHAAKQGTLRKLVSEEAFNFMVNPHPVHGEGLCPELLLYKPDFSEWCFCTVTGPKNTLLPKQARYWQELMALTGKKIMMVSLKEAP